MKFTYLLIDLGTLILPLIFSFHGPSPFYKSWKMILPSIGISALLFVLWDSYFTHLGIWGFNNRYILGIKVGNLPIEEVLFFICIPYACLFTYHLLGAGFIMNDYSKKLRWLNILFLVGFILAAAIFYNKLYTTCTFWLLAGLIGYTGFIRKVTWLPRFYVFYCILLIPFVVVNGILTGTGLAEPIVWYAPENLIGFRMFTIPVEDIFYGMALILLNILVCSWIRDKVSKVVKPGLV